MEPKELLERAEGTYHRVYDDRLREELERTAWGKYLIIDIETGEYLVADTREDAVDQFDARFPNSPSCMVRISTPRLVG